MRIFCLIVMMLCTPKVFAAQHFMGQNIDALVNKVQLAAKSQQTKLKSNNCSNFNGTWKKIACFSDGSSKPLEKPLEMNIKLKKCSQLEIDGERYTIDGFTSKSNFSINEFDISTINNFSHYWNDSQTILHHTASITMPFGVFLIAGETSLENIDNKIILKMQSNFVGQQLRSDYGPIVFTPEECHYEKI